MQKTVLITGSNAGFGRLSAELFAKRGWNVAATMRFPEKAGDLADMENVNIYQLDVTDTVSIQKAADNCLVDFGKVDVVVNNAGFGVYGACEKATQEQIDQIFDVNVKGVIKVMKAFLPHFRSRKEGMFINISSIAGLISYPLGSIYNSTKWALEGLTEGMVFELQPLGIKLKLVEPGGFSTNFIRLGLQWTKDPEITDYDEMTKTIRTQRDLREETLPDPIAVAEKIWEAANDPSHRLRYLVGDDAHTMWKNRQELGDDAFIKKLMPS